MSDFTPRGKMVIYTDWDVSAIRGTHGATTDDVWARAEVIGGPSREFHGTDETVTDWVFRVMAAAGEHGVAVELRDGRG